MTRVHITAPSLALVSLFATTLGGCIERRAFDCGTDEDCDLGSGGVCQAGGLCSYTDAECESGQRYEDEAGGDCVVVEPVAELSCSSYCDLFLDACSGPTNPYRDPTNCADHCAQWPTGALDDQSGDSLGCRINRANLAQQGWSPPLNCLLAGPSGGDQCVDPGAPQCEQYCTVLRDTCDPNIDVMACVQLCNGWYPGTATPQDEIDSVGCRLVRVLAAAMSQDPNERMMLCVLAAPDSPLCTLLPAS